MARSPLVDVRLIAEQLWEEALPPTDPAIRYASAASSLVLGGSVASRAFVHRPPSGRVELEVSGDLTVYEYAWTAVLYLSESSLTNGELFDATLNEPKQLHRLINTYAAWPAGVRFVHTEGHVTVPGDGDLWEIEFTFRAQVEEQ